MELVLWWSAKHSGGRDMSLPTSDRFGIEGHVSHGFEAVHEAFAENFVRRHESGGACCAFRYGERVVDLRGGIRNEQTGEPWQQDTMVVVHSATRGKPSMFNPCATQQAGLGCLYG
jgi:hypothetical protein